jgi:hypothetical protein
MLDKLPKSLQGVVYQYLTGPEVIRLERVNRKVRAGAVQDYIWRYLTENTLAMTRFKFFKDTWKMHYWRNFSASEFMTPQKFNYAMCPIRHFKDIVKLIDSYNNFVFAADKAGNLGIFLINEEDMENDEETLKVHQFTYPDGVEYLKHSTKYDTSLLTVITGGGIVYSYQIDLEGPQTF